MADPILCRGLRYFLARPLVKRSILGLNRQTRRNAPRHPSTGQQSNRDCHFRRGLFDPDEHHGDFPDLACRTGGRGWRWPWLWFAEDRIKLIPGVILSLEGQATVRDYVELDRGEAGTIVKTTVRSMILETYDGLWIVVPNEDFITIRVVSYSDQGSANRYEADFSVSYDT